MFALAGLLFVVLCIVVVSALFALVSFLRTWRSWNLKDQISLVLIATLAFARLYFHPPLHHAMYVDESWYIEAARRIVHEQSVALCDFRWTGPHCTPYPKSLGWPVMVAVAGVLARSFEIGALRLSLLLGAMSVAFAGALGRLVSRSWVSALAASVIAATIPSHVAWSATAETSTPAAAFVLLGLVGTLSFLRDPKWYFVALGLGSLTLGATIRPEPSTAIVFAVGAMLMVPSSLRLRVGVIVFGIASLIVCVVCAIPMWKLNREIVGGAFLSMHNVSINARELLRHDGEPRYLGVLLVLALVTIATSMIRGFSRLEVITIVAATLGVTVPSLAFDPHHFTERLIVIPLLCLAPLAGSVGGTFAWTNKKEDQRPGLVLVSAFIAVATSLVLGIHLRQRLPEILQPPESQLLETEMASQFPGVSSSNALFITEWPTVLSTERAIDVMRTDQAMSHPSELWQLAQRRPVFFACDMFCEPGFADGHWRCADMLAQATLVPVRTIGEGHRRYGLFRVVGPRTAQAPVVNCPFVR